MNNLNKLTQKWMDFAKNNPDHLAVIELETELKWSYLKLYSKAKEIADEWRPFIEPRQRIALTMDAGALWIASVWAAWMLELVWCPILHSTPSSRLQYQMEILDPILVFDGIQTQFLKPQIKPCAPDAAYLIFTSGSTGQPKGVLVGWMGIENLWQEQIKAFDLNESSHCVWMLSPAFDASLSDVGTTLSSGGTLHVVPKGRWNSGKKWLEDVNHYQITHMDAPPSLLAIWARHQESLFKKGFPQSLKTLIVGGEASPSFSIEFWTKKVNWINVYGPTEVTVCSSLENKTVLSDSTQATLGRPLKNFIYRVFPLDTHDPNEKEVLQGELWIGGPGVALEYWQMKSLTQEKFFIDNQGQRWFKTGDWVGVEQNFNQEFSFEKTWVYYGRTDRQIKRNGQLLNLEEVELVLKNQMQSEVCVFIDQNQQIILTYFNPLSEKEIEILKAKIKNILPPWGIPQKWFLTQIQRTISGKIDRKKLEEEWSQQI